MTESCAAEEELEDELGCAAEGIRAIQLKTTGGAERSILGLPTALVDYAIREIEIGDKPPTCRPTFHIFIAALPFRSFRSASCSYAACCCLQGLVYKRLGWDWVCTRPEAEWGWRLIETRVRVPATS